MSIASHETYDVRLNLHFDLRRIVSIEVPLIITYRGNESAREDEVQGFHKIMIFEVISNNFANLQKPNQIVSHMVESIVPGEKPEFLGDFIPKHKLQQYQLTSQDLEIFNSGLNAKKIDARYQGRLLEIKQLVDVEDPMNCLTAKTYCKMLDLLLFLEEHQMKIDIRNYDTVTNKLEHIRDNLYLLPVPELSENRSSMIMGDPVYVKESGAEIKYEGIVHAKGMDYVLLGFSHKFSDLYIKKKKFEVSFSINRAILKFEHQATMLARDCAGYFLPIEIRPLTPECLQISSRRHSYINTKITANQCNAVTQIVYRAERGVPYLIIGPSGTGKTTTIVEAILEVRKVYPKKRILVCAPSNRVANLICTQLLRFRQFSVGEMLRYISYCDNILEIPDEMLMFCNLQNYLVCHPTLASLVEFKIVITSLVTAGRLYNIGISQSHFSYVFIDDANNATEIETLIPITAALDKAFSIGKVILVGDPNQLGPIVHSSKALQYGFGVSMLERLMNSCSRGKKHPNEYDIRVVTKLLKNFRSHPDIIAFSNEAFYDGEIISAGNEFSNLALGHEVLPNTNFPLIFHSVLGNDQRESNSRSFFNIQEITVVFDYLNSLVGSRMCEIVVKASDIAVITPYGKQMQMIRKMCDADSRFADLVIGNVEQLQGQERLIVIISTVRSNPEFVKHDVKSHLGFLMNPRRMNVALTRAKALLIVVGNPNLLKYDDNWRNFIQRCVANEATAGADFSLHIDEDADDPLAGFEDIN